MDDRTRSIRIFLLGRFEVVRGEHILASERWTRRKAASLLQRLALERRLLKEQAIDFLWPESDPDSGANNLYRTLHVLRKTVNESLGNGVADQLFSFESGVLSLDESVWVDAHEFQRLCEALPAAPSDQRTAALVEALTLYEGELLPDDRYADWTLLQRETLHRQQREIRLALAAQARGTGNQLKAIELLAPLLAYDAADEFVHRELMHLYALDGRRHEALRQYQACVEALADELDVSPTPETTGLYSQIVNGTLTPQLASDLAARVSPPPAIPDAGRSGTLVGREAEMDKMRAWLNAARQHEGRTILLAGDTGMGKTRLAFEVLRVAASKQMTVLRGTAYEQEGQLPYQPYIEAINRYLVERGLPLKDNPITNFEQLASTDPQQQQWALFDSTATFFTTLATEAPLMLLVDDLQAADETSLHLFHYLARQTRNAPVVLLATYRTDVADRAMAFSNLRNALYREQLGETLDLSPLSLSDTTGIVNHILQGRAAPSLSDAVHKMTEGVPFFIEEISRALLKSGTLERDGEGWHLGADTKLPVPSGLNDLLLERVFRLGPAIESALIAAAIIGREFSFNILSGVAVADDDSGLLNALDAALEGHLLEETENGYQFRHPLIRRVLYAAPSRVRRARLHARAGEAVEAVYAQRPGELASQAEALAFHYDLSDRRDRALNYLVQAGEHAANVYAFEVAVDYFERALDLMDALHMADAARLWEIHESLGWWQSILADTPRSVGHFEQALALSATDDWQPSASAQASLHRGAAVTLLTVGDTAAAEGHLRAALEKMDKKQDTAIYARVLYNLAQFHWHQNENQEAFEVAQRSLEIAKGLDDPASIARAYEMLALACHSLGEWQQGMEFERQRAALVGPALDVTDAFDVHL